MSRPALFVSSALMIMLFGTGVAPVPSVTVPTDHALRSSWVSGHEGVWVEREAFLMGTRLRVRLLAGDRASGIRAAEAAFAMIREQEAILSSWHPDSELGRLNRAPPETSVSLSPALAEVLSEASHWWTETGGAFDPSIGALVDAWALRGPGRIPSGEEIGPALGAVGMDLFPLDEADARVTRRDAAAWLDAGAFGKGAALREAARALASAGIADALLDFGGQMVVMGSPIPEGQGWPVSVAHPRDRSEPALELVLRDTSVATSGASERLRLVDGLPVSHIVDPRTGMPVSAWGSVTAIADDPLAADALATALFVMGPEAGMVWARDRSDVGALFLTVADDGELSVRWNGAMEDRLGRAPAVGSAVRGGIHAAR